MKITTQATLSIRRNLAATHLQAAAAAARIAYEVEQGNDTNVFGAWFDQMIQTVPVSIVMAGAALEVSANEFVQIFWIKELHYHCPVVVSYN